MAQGKPAAGHITIAARQQSGHIEIMITDDGCGIRTEKLCQRLIKRGIFPKEHLHQMEEAEIVNTIFLPGVSTSEIITDISGRGFGMDIVKTEIEQLKGSVALTSQPGKGTQCVLTLPVTLTTLRCLIFSSRGQQFAVPIDTIEETLHISQTECIQVVGHDAIRLRNQMVYIVALADTLQLPRTAFHDPEKMFVLVARSGTKRIGFIVDEILDEQDVVVKQLPTHMRRLKTIAGVSISGENRIVLIVHIPEIIKHIKHTLAEHDVSTPEKAVLSRPKILVVEDSVNTGEIEKLILESQGYDVEVMQDGADALEHINHSRYDLIVTDVEMPGMDGFSLTEHVRNLPSYAHIPIVIVTSLEREADKRRGIQVGADAYITKGDFEQTHLVETVKSLLQVAT
jgi:CheY-like chemotaxis protein